MGKQPALSINLKKLEPHPLGAMFPPMGDEEYDRLIASMKERGFDSDQKIVLFEGKILDGNNRYTGARKARVEPLFTEFKGTPIEAMSYVVGKNLARRNLTPSQSAALGAELVEMMDKAEKAVRDAEKAAAKEAKKAGKEPAKKEKKKAQGRKTARAAKVVNVSERSVAAAAALKKSDPAEFEAVKTGSKRLHGAQTAAERKSEEFARAKEILEKAIDADFALLAEKSLPAKDVVRMSELDSSEIKRIKPLIESGWKLKPALGYKSTSLQLVHPMRSFIDRAVANGGQLSWEAEAYGKKFTVEIKQAVNA